MYIRQTKTSNTLSGEAYFTFRLVASKRIEGKVRQQTLLNLGRNFSLPREEWPQLCSRIEEILSGQISLLEIPEHVEKLAQRYAARLVVNQGGDQQEETKGGLYHEVDISSLELVNPRSIGVEHAGLSALQELGLPEILDGVGMNGVQQAAALGSIIGRMANPGSELSTYEWLTEQSGLGEILDVDYQAMPNQERQAKRQALQNHRWKRAISSCPLYWKILSIRLQIQRQTKNLGFWSLAGRISCNSQGKTEREARTRPFSLRCQEPSHANRQCKDSLSGNQLLPNGGPGCCFSQPGPPAGE